jgi:hypothetical protein
MSVYYAPVEEVLGGRPSGSAFEGGQSRNDRAMLARKVDPAFFSVELMNGQLLALTLMIGLVAAPVLTAQERGSSPGAYPFAGRPDRKVISSSPTACGQ